MVFKGKRNMRYCGVQNIHKIESTQGIPGKKPVSSKAFTAIFSVKMAALDIAQNFVFCWLHPSQKSKPLYAAGKASSYA